MEEFQEQEYEFLRRLEEERIDRRTLVRRGLGAGIGLTVLSLSPGALAARKQALANPPVAGRLVSMAEMIKEAKKEGSLNTIALPRDWANYGEMMDTFGKKYGIKITNDNPDGSSAQENQAIRSLKGDSRAPDCVDVGVSFAIAGANEGLYAKYFPKNYKTITGVQSRSGTTGTSSPTRRRRGRTCSSPSTRARLRSTAVRSRPTRPCPA